MTTATIEVPEGGWQVQPAAYQLVADILDIACQNSPWLDQLRRDMLQQSGTRLVDWIDHLAVPPQQVLAADGSLDGDLSQRLQACGFQTTPIAVADSSGGKILGIGFKSTETYWMQPLGIFPKIQCSNDVIKTRVAIKVDSVSDFLVAHGLQHCEIQGRAGGRMQKALVNESEVVQVYVVARQGWPHWELPSESDQNIADAVHHLDSLRRRDRGVDQDQAFSTALERIEQAVGALGQDWACALFFQAEREFWQFRNQAARVQKRRQDVLGLGWANHDHHTYRCSRDYFPQLIHSLETLGVRCRERFYAGKQAGWGAQVLEHPTGGIVIFADVDLLPEELSGDFAHEGFAPLDKLGTVGLWCMLHGDSFAGAGLHHLECQFEFQAAREQLEAAGIGNMNPFTDFDHLKQSFTAPETWTVNPTRLQKAVDCAAITQQQAQQMTAKGAIGSHLEVLERNDGYKGFNQTGISDIIAKTDPRKILEASN